MRYQEWILLKINDGLWSLNHSETFQDQSKPTLDLFNYFNSELDINFVPASKSLWKISHHTRTVEGLTPLRFEELSVYFFWVSNLIFHDITTEVEVDYFLRQFLASVPFEFETNELLKFFP